MEIPIELRVSASGRPNELPEGWERSLPVEILEDVFFLSMTDCHGRIPSGIVYRRSTIQPHLRSLAGVCKTWYAMVTPVLYQEVFISSSDALAAFARSVTTHPHLQPLVYSFLYSSTIFKSGTVEYSQADNWNLDRIYHACTYLRRLVVSRDLRRRPNDDRLVAISLGIEMSSLATLTRLEVKLPEGVPCDGRLLFSSSFTLPFLQELILEVLPIEANPEKPMLVPRHAPHGMEWPHMPELTRLCIINWHVKHACFDFPPHCEKLRVLEILGGNYSSILDFFHHSLGKAPALESITITASRVAYDQTWTDLRFLSSLTELCISLKTFNDWFVYWFPESLEEIVLTGCPEKGYNESSLAVLRRAEDRLAWLLELHGMMLENLKVVRVVVNSFWMRRLAPVVTFKKAKKMADAVGVKLSFEVKKDTLKDSAR